MRFDPDDLAPDVIAFLRDRHLATLSLVPSADEVHVSPVGFTWDDEAKLARVITFGAAKKVRLLKAAGSLPAALTQIDGPHWLALHGRATVTDDPAVNADAEQRYAERYRPPRNRGGDRHTIIVEVDRVLGRVPSEQT